MVRCIIKIKPENRKRYTEYLWRDLDGQGGEIVRYQYCFNPYKTIEMIRVKPDRMVYSPWNRPSESWAVYPEDVIPTTLL